MTSYVVDYERLKRITVPDVPKYSLATKVYTVLIILCLAVLFKRWRDKKLSSSSPESDSEIIYPLVPNGL